MIVGIDPGLTGALALLDGERCIEVVDMPVADGAVASALLADQLREWAEGGQLVVILERVGARPGQGVSSMFRFGRSVGAVEGVVGALSLPLTQVTPQVWKRSARLSGAEKDASRRRAIELWPEQAGALKRKKDVGRAEAMLIGQFGAR